MCRKIIYSISFILLLGLALTGTASAELQLFDDFETGTTDDSQTSGVLGGFRDCESNNTGNVNLESGAQGNPTQVYRLEGNSSGDERGFTVTGVNNPINDGESGLLFFRFVHRADGRKGYSWYGITSLDMTAAGDNALNSGNENNADEIVSAGFLAARESTTGNDPIYVVRIHDWDVDDPTLDNAEILFELTPGTWYDCWIDADNSADTFNLYIQESTDLGGPPEQPTSNPILVDEPFNIPGTDALRGFICMSPDDPPRPWDDRAIRMYVDDLWWDGDQGLKAPTTARNPIPTDADTDVPREVTLSWEATQFPVTHDVYFGDVLEDVIQATPTSGAAGIYKGRVIPNSYTLPERLKFEVTYYWRIDEVNISPDNTVHRGNVWSFETELLAYPIENVTAAASSSAPGKGADNTVNGSGLDDNGLLHDNASMDTMWLSEFGAEQPTWIIFEFDGIHKLYEMWVWNSNESLEQQVGMGFKDVTIQYSTDGVEYETLGTTHEFTQGPGTADYEHNTTIKMEGVAAKYVKLTANSNWKGLFEQYGLSEVRFFSIPVMASEPSPDLEAVEVELDLMLGWRAGREADTHEVYFSEDLQAVTDGTATMTPVTDTSYGPLSLDVGKTYYWRVDEVNDIEIPAVWPGNIWSFTTLDSLLVEDFESYNAEDNQIWWAWKDGLGYVEHDNEPAYGGNGTGSIVGVESTNSFTEETIVHGGGKSMPLAYDNNKQGYLNYSEATMKLTSQRDWTIRGVGELSIWFRGLPGSVGSFVEEPAGTYTITAAGSDIYGQADEFHFAYKQLSGVGSIIAKVESVENTNTWAKAGVMIRETLDAGSKFAGVYIMPTNDDGTATNGCRFQGRDNTDGGASSDSSVATNEQMAIIAPYWVKLERDFSGNFRGYYSSDGLTWTSMAWRPAITMGSDVYIGLALTSHDEDLTCEAKFSGVQTTGTVTGQWQSQDIGIASNSGESMYVAVGNSTGTPALIFHDDPAATQTGDWTEWIIPTQALADQGVNLADVDNITIGIGDRNNPQAGGSGTVYIDDIRLYGLREAE